MYMHFLKHLKGVDITILNKGEELIITAKGSKELIANLEKKLGALKELCSGCCEGQEDCC